MTDLGPSLRGSARAVAGGRRALKEEHLYRDVRAPRIYEGASEIQREIIARHLYR